MAMNGKTVIILSALLFCVPTTKAQKACPNATNVAEVCVFGIYTGPRIMIDMSTYSTTVPNCKCTFATTTDSLKLIPVTAPNNRRCGSAVRVNLASGNNLRFQCLVPGTVLDTSLYKDGSLEFEAYGSQYDSNYCMALEHVGGADDSVTVYCEGAVATTTVSTSQSDATTDATSAPQTNTLSVHTTTNNQENITASTMSVTEIPVDAYITTDVPTNSNFSSNSSYHNITTVSIGIETTTRAVKTNTDMSGNARNAAENISNITEPTFTSDNNEPTTNTPQSLVMITTNSYETNKRELVVNMDKFTTPTTEPLTTLPRLTESNSTLNDTTEDMLSSNWTTTHTMSPLVGAIVESDNNTNNEILTRAENNPLSNITDTNITVVMAENTTNDTVLMSDNTIIDTVVMADNTTNDTVFMADNTTIDTVIMADNTTIDTVIMADNTTIDTVIMADNTTNDTVVMADNTTIDTVIMADNTTIDTVIMADNTTIDIVIMADNTTNDTVVTADNTTNDTVIMADNTTNDTVVMTDNTIIFRPPTTPVTPIENDSTVIYEMVTQTDTRAVDTTVSATSVPMLILEPVQYISSNDTSLASNTTDGATDEPTTDMRTMVMEHISQLNTTRTMHSVNNLTTSKNSQRIGFQTSTTTPVALVQTGTWTTSIISKPTTSNKSDVTTVEAHTIPEATTYQPPSLESIIQQLENMPASTVPQARTVLNTSHMDISFDDKTNTTADATMTDIPSVTEASFGSTHAVSDDTHITDMERILRAVIQLLRQDPLTTSASDRTTPATDNIPDNMHIHPTITSSETEGIINGIDIKSIISNALLTVAESSPRFPSTTTPLGTIQYSPQSTYTATATVSHAEKSGEQSNISHSSIISTMTTTIDDITPATLATSHESTSMPNINHVLKSYMNLTSPARLVVATSSPSSSTIRSTPTATTSAKNETSTVAQTIVTRLPTLPSNGGSTVATNIHQKIPPRAPTTATPLQTEDIAEQTLESLRTGNSPAETTTRIPTTTSSTVEPKTSPPTTAAARDSPIITVTEKANTINVTDTTQTRTRQKSYEVMIDDIVVNDESPGYEPDPTDDPDTAKPSRDWLIFHVDRHLILALIGGIAIFAILVAILVMAINHSRKGRQMKATISGSMISSSTGPPSFRNNLFDNGALDEIEKGVPSPLPTPGKVSAENRKGFRQANNYSGDIGAR